MSGFKKFIPFYALICVLAIFAALALSHVGKTVSVMNAEQPITVVIDAGHGGEDGGALSVSGVAESGINLQIALRLNDFLHLMGVKTAMIRTEDVSVYTEGSTIAQKKVSDIRNRVRIIQQTPNALLVSIHQNQYSEAKYRGAQVFYAKGSEALAEQLQSLLIRQVDPNNHRECKQAKDIYLMEHIDCTAVLVECGFLSNYEEEQLLRDASYQKKLIAAIGCGISAYLEESNEV